MINLFSKDLQPPVRKSVIALHLSSISGLKYRGQRLGSRDHDDYSCWLHTEKQAYLVSH